MKHLKCFALTLTCCGLLGFLAAPALGVPLSVVSLDGPQDPLSITGDVHELGDGFPINELIESSWVPTTRRSCFEPGNIDDPTIPNILVSITNLSPIRWSGLHYVADYDPTPPAGVPAQWVTISNFDGFIGNNANDLSQAFRIDNVGINVPLVSESMVADLIFEPGETWEFILQDWAAASGIAGNANPTPFGSIGIAGGSPNALLSTGSIIAVPEPCTVIFTLGLVGLGQYYRQRRRKQAAKLM